jgi:hypothetical protein
VLRLLVPFAFGILVVVPPQVYYERLAAGEFRGSYLAFYPHYFEGLYFLGGNFSWFGHHLWFLLALFAISIVTRPIVLALGRTERIERLARIVDRAGPFVFFGAPVLVLQLALRRVGLVDPFVFVLFFLYGSLLAADARFVSAIQAQRWLALALAIATSAAYAALFLAGIVTLDDLSRHSWHYAALQTLAGFTTWAWPHALLAFGSRFANRPARLLGEVNEAVMPFYVLHQTVIIAVGYYVISSSLGTLAKLAVIATTSFTFTVFIYFSAIRSVAPVRVLLGMRRRRAG